jgi:Family of unknown function (DUF6081)
MPTYDALAGPILDPALWMPARLPLPSGDEHVPRDPNADLVVGEGELRVTIPRFSLAHDSFQAVDSVKHLVLSTRKFEVAADHAVTFGADLAVANLDGQPADYRRGIAAFQVADLADTRRVFSVCGTSTRVLAMHERLPGGEAREPFIHVIESPYQDFDDDLTHFRACEVTLDRGSATVVWRVNGRTIYAVHGAVIPERVRIACGIYTMLAIRDGHSRCLEGQGIDARWRRFRVPRSPDADAPAPPL